MFIDRATLFSIARFGGAESSLCDPFHWFRSSEPRQKLLFVRSYKHLTPTE